MTIFQGTAKAPFHLSAGALLVNSKGEIACHFFKKEDLPYESEGKRDLYLLMRETPRLGESIEQTVKRGIIEEFGAKATVKHFIGALESWFPGVKTGLKINKTTLYFLADLVNFDPKSRINEDPESKSQILWITPEKLIGLFRDQGKAYDRTDLDESIVVERYIDYVRN